MPIFGHGKSTDWHQQIDATANGQHPSTTAGELNPIFPWDQLQQHTNAYLKRKGKLATLERDKKLASLIREHDSKDIAMAACALLMSPMYIRDMVRQELNIHPTRSHDLHSFLQIVVAASHQSPEAIDRQEAQRAQWLIPFCSRPTAADSSTFRALMLLFTNLIPTHSITYPHTETLARKGCTSFVKQLEEVRNASLWLSAHTMTEWLSTLTGVSLDLSAQSFSMLQDIFPTWRTWESWRPSLSRLQLWDRFDRDQREVLQDLLALEGPDFTDSGKSTLGEGLIGTRQARGSRFAIVHGNINIELVNGEFKTAQHVVNLLLCTIDAACEAGPAEVDLLTHFCVGTTLDTEGLHILGLVHALGDASVTAAMLRVHNARTADRKEQLDAIIQFLPILGNPGSERLRDVLAPYLLDNISNCLEELQNDLVEILEVEGNWDGTEYRLQAFGQGVKDTDWIRPLLNRSLQELFDNWPTKRTIEALHDLRTAVLKMQNDNPKKDVSNEMERDNLDLQARFAKLRQNIESIEPSIVASTPMEEFKVEEPIVLVKLIDQYCMDTLVLQDAISPLHKTLVKAFIDFWHEAPDDNRRTIAFLVTGGISCDLEYIRKVLGKLPGLPNDFIVKLRAQLQQYVGDVHGDVACVNLARMLASTHLYDAIESWKPVLDRMINQRGQLLFDYAVESLDAQGWIQWLSDLRQIYGTVLIGIPGNSVPVRWSHLMKWGERLETYLPTIISLQTALGRGDWLRCIQVGSRHYLLSKKAVDTVPELPKVNKKIKNPKIEDDWGFWTPKWSKKAKDSNKTNNVPSTEEIGDFLDGVPTQPTADIKKVDSELEPSKVDVKIEDPKIEDDWGSWGTKKSKKAKKSKKENDMVGIDGVDEWASWGVAKSKKDVKVTRPASEASKADVKIEDPSIEDDWGSWGSKQSKKAKKAKKEVVTGIEEVDEWAVWGVPKPKTAVKTGNSGLGLSAADMNIENSEIEDDWGSWGFKTSKKPKKATKVSAADREETDDFSGWNFETPKKKSKKAISEVDPLKNDAEIEGVWDFGTSKKNNEKTISEVQLPENDTKIEDVWDFGTSKKLKKKDIEYVTEEADDFFGWGSIKSMKKSKKAVRNVELPKNDAKVDNPEVKVIWGFETSKESKEKEGASDIDTVDDWASWGVVKPKIKAVNTDPEPKPEPVEELEMKADDDDLWFAISEEDREKGRKAVDPTLESAKADVKVENLKVAKDLGWDFTKTTTLDKKLKASIKEAPKVEELEDILIEILKILRREDEKLYRPIFHKAILSLKRDGTNAAPIYSVASLVTKTTSYGVDACRRVLDMYEQASAQVAEAFLGLYKNSNDMRQSDVAALNSLAKILALNTDLQGSVDGTSLDAATDYLVDEFNKIYEEARRLEDLRVAFKAADPEGTAALLESLGIEDSTPAQDALANLPAGLIDLVELVGDQEVEMQIPLTLTALQRVALGVGTANNIIIRLGLPESDFPLAFCIHLDNEPKANKGHRPWPVSDGNRAPTVPVCFGRPNRMLYQLSRTLFRHLQEGYTSLADVHRVLIASLKDISQHCIVCGRDLRAQIRRSTLCKSTDCVRVFARSRLTVRLSDIHDDAPAVDALLTLVYAAAASNKPELLPDCPITDLQTVKQILNLMPAVSQLKNVSDMSVVFKSRHAQTEELLSWALNSHRGFFTSASGHLRIPGMAGANQFIMASVAPELEIAFAAQVVLNGGITRVVFHATSLDRVFSILTQGLQIHSNTGLQRTGAYYGRGIYVAEEPSTAAGFFAPHNAAAMWTAGTLKNVRVLLGCELAGSGTVPPNTKIHVVTNPSQLIVRHVFLMPPTAVVPTLSTHVTPAMGSVFAFLRSSAA